MPLSPLRAGDPTAIGGFRLVARLGSGGMGVVYVGTDRAGRPAAVKSIRAEHAADPRFRSRFRREVAAARAVEGACTARVLDADPDAVEPWLATEYVGGASLHDVVHADGPLSDDLLHALAAGLAEALVAIHEAGVVHRDLKPANVLLAPDGPKVIDFGIAALESATSSTRTGVGLGSPGYMAPEQVTGNSTVGPPVDIYAWGLTVLFAATGRPPFGSGPAQALMYRAVLAEVDLSGLPGWIEPLVRSALAREPGDRPKAREVLAALVQNELRTVESGDAATVAYSGTVDQRTNGPATAARSPRPTVEETGALPGEAVPAEETERILRREWQQPAAARAPELPSQPLIRTDDVPRVGATQIRETRPEPEKNSRIPLVLTGVAVFASAGLLAWLLVPSPDRNTETNPSTNGETSAATSPSTAATATAQPTTPSSSIINGIPTYTADLGDQELAAGFNGFIAVNQEKAVRIEAASAADNSYFVENPSGESGYDEPNFTLFECEGLTEGQQPAFWPDAPCTATTYLLDLDEDSEASFRADQGRSVLEGYFEIDVEDTEQNLTTVKLSGLDAEDALDTEA